MRLLMVATGFPPDQRGGGCALMAGSIWGMRQLLPFSSDLLMNFKFGFYDMFYQLAPQPSVDLQRKVSLRSRRVAR